MSFPNIPDVDPKMDITETDAINLLLASIAFEELGLAHIINAEAEKIQSILGTLYNQNVKNPTIDDLERIDKAVERILKDVIKKEIILQFKLEDVLSISTSSTTSTTTTSSTTTISTTSTSTSTSTTTTSTTTTSTTTTGTTTTSQCGTVWNLRNSTTINDLTDVAFGNNTFVDVGLSGTVITLHDGVTWTQQTTPTTNLL